MVLFHNDGGVSSDRPLVVLATKEIVFSIHRAEGKHVRFHLVTMARLSICSDSFLTTVLVIIWASESFLTSFIAFWKGFQRDSPVFIGYIQRGCGQRLSVAQARLKQSEDVAVRVGHIAAYDSC